MMNLNILAIIVIISKATLAQEVHLIVLGEQKINKHLVKRAVGHDPPKIKEFIVKTTVANRFAETHVISKVENAEKSPKQTIFSVVLPEKAFISGFFMEIKGVTYKAFVLEKEEAKKVYSQSVSAGQSAAHVAVSMRNSNRFAININVEPESKVTFHLTYEELLQREKGVYEIIANIQPGQVVKKLEVEVTINESRPLLFVTTPSLRSGNVLVKNNVHLDPHAKIKISNTSAAVTFRPDVNRQLEFACAGLGNKEYDGFAGQFIVMYDIERDSQGGETLFQDGFFINFFAPPNLDPIPKHIIFVLDKSGSMGGTKIVQLKEAMMTILPQLYPEDVFDIVQYNSEVYIRNSKGIFVNIIPSPQLYGNLATDLQKISLSDGVPATKQNIDEAKNIINSMSAESATNTLGGLEAGLYLAKLVQEKYKDKYQPILVFLTDGLPVEGITDTAEIIRLVQTINQREYKTPIYSVCIGDDADWNFLRELSLATDGKPRRIHVDKVTYPDVSSQLVDFYEKIGTPVLSNVSFSNLPQSSQFTKIRIPIFFNGSEITIAGKGVAGNGSKPITISARGKKGPLELVSKVGIPLARLERVWAYLTTKQFLEDYYATSSQADKTKLSKLVLEIALKYSLVTDMTSLVVVRPNDTSSSVDVEDASKGIFPQSANELPMCNNVTQWIITNFGTPEPTTIEPTTPEPTTPDSTTLEPTTLEPTTLEPTTVEPTTTEIHRFIGEFDGGINDPTTTEIPTTTERIKICNESTFGCCHDGVSFAVGYNFSGCDPIPKSESCSLSQDIGPCNNMTRKWVYDNKIGECREFWYSGCEGNGNRFKSRDICEQACVKPTGSDRCKLPIFLGKCGKYKLNWFYDKETDECVKKLYSGCLGNSNRFDTKLECNQHCVSPSKKISRQDACYLSKDGGTCRKFQLLHYFDLKNGVCRQFWYGGCNGNDNRFKTEAECNKVCINPDGQEVCQLPRVEGTCSSSVRRWYYDRDQKTCTQFNYSGCKGNKNNFANREECHKSCVTGSGANLQESCFLKENSGTCTKYEPKWSFNRKIGSCRQFWYGGCDGNDNRFNTEEQCKDICINPKGKDRCKLPRIPGPCSNNQTRWYYNTNKKHCKQFNYSGCFGNSNNFVSLDECKRECS